MSDPTQAAQQSAKPVPVVEIEIEPEDLGKPIEFYVPYTVQVVIRVKPQPFLFSA